jgi:hypothetical protein
VGIGIPHWSEEDLFRASIRARPEYHGDMLLATAIPCPVCEAPARVLDWSPGVDWLVIEGCSCGSYRVRADLVATRRLKHLALAERRLLQERIHAITASDQEAWVDTETGTMRGPLVVLAAQPRHTRLPPGPYR